MKLTINTFQGFQEALDGDEVNKVESESGRRLLESDNKSNSNWVVPLVLSIIMVMLPHLLLTFLNSNQSKLNNESFKVRYGAMYQNLKAKPL